MDVVKIIKKNEAFIRVETDSGIEMELSEHFTFYVPGYKFMPSYRNKMWDGKIRLFDTRNKQIYSGLRKYIKEFCSARGYEFIHEVDSHKELVFDTSLVSLPFSIRDYQENAIQHIIKNKTAVLLSPTGSGKSLIIYLLVRFYLEYSNEKDILIIVPTTSLVEQMSSDFSVYSKDDDYFYSEASIHTIYSGKEKNEINKRIIISTWQSIFKMPLNWFMNVGMVIGDEAHTFKAKSLTSIMTKCLNAEFRIGTTGTLDGTETHQLVLEGLFGPVFRVTSTKELIESDTLAELKINILLLKYSEQYRKENKDLNYQNEIDLIVRNIKRNNFITNLSVEQKGNTLILFQYVEKHGKALYELLKNKIDSNRKLFFISGSTPVDDRENFRNITETEKNAIIVASSGTFSTGINIRNLHNIIFASPSKSQIKVLQSIGRGLRKSDNNEPTTLYDIGDDLHWKSRKNYTLKHLAERIKIYSKEKFDYKIYEIEI